MMSQNRGQRVEAICRGRVQGVGFRWFVQRRAQALGARGWVRNEPDGSVKVVAEGLADVLETLLRQLHEGPSGSRVHEIKTTWGEATNQFTSFEIRF